MNAVVLVHTVSEKILLAAYDLEQQGHSPFSAEALIVAAWHKFPESFGLKGYADQFPDSNKVLSSIMGEKGLARRGWLAKMGQKLYTTTREGQAIAARILQVEPVVPVPKIPKLTRDQEKLLLSLLESSALEKFQQGRKQDLTFADACRYWTINDTMQGDTLDSRMAVWRGELADIQQILNNDEVVLSNGRSVGAGDASLLQKANKHLEERFSRHLNVLRSRAVRN